jgi:hypothetical protein
VAEVACSSALGDALPGSTRTARLLLVSPPDERPARCLRLSLGRRQDRDLLDQCRGDRPLPAGCQIVPLRTKTVGVADELEDQVLGAILPQRASHGFDPLQQGRPSRLPLEAGERSACEVAAMVRRRLSATSTADRAFLHFTSLSRPRSNAAGSASESNRSCS